MSLAFRFFCLHGGRTDGGACRGGVDGTILQIAARMKVEKSVMQEQREAEEGLAVFMNRRLVKEVCTQQNTYIFVGDFILCQVPGYIR